MSEDVKEQVMNEMKASPMFSLQVDETINVASCAQVLVFVRYIHLRDVNEEFLFCSEQEATTRSADIMKNIETFFNTAKLQWKNVCGVFTDGATAMLDSHSSFRKKLETCSSSKRYTLCYLQICVCQQNVISLSAKCIKFGDKNCHLHQIRQPQHTSV